MMSSVTTGVWIILLIHLPVTVAQVTLQVDALVTSYIPVIGSTVTLNCVVTQGTPTEIRWYKYGQLVGINTNQRFSGGTLSNPPLTITNLQASDGGTYECEATDGTQTDRTSAITLSPIPLLLITAPQTIYNVVLGNNVVLNCVVTVGTVSTIKWYKNSQEIVMFANPRYSGGNVNTPPLTITNSQMSDAGTYECEGSDPFTTVRTDFITVNILVPLAVTATTTIYTPNTGDTITLNCEITSGSASTITWYKDGQSLDIINNARLSGASPANPSLIITNTQMTDAGSYECEASDGTQTAKTNAITVSPIAPLEISAPVTSYNPTSGQTLTINCVVTSGTATSIVWYKDNQQIDPPANTRLFGGTSGSPPLVISPVNENDSGTYVCEASDGTNTVQTNQISLVVQVPLAVNAPVTSYTPTLGQNLTINCVITSGTASNITWYRNGQQVVIANDARISGGSKGSPSLMISPVQTGDAGAYLCEASDGTTTVQTEQISVNVYVPLGVTATTTSYTPTVGQTLTINCVVTSGTPTTITWFRNGQTVAIANDARLSGGSKNSPPLVISPVQSGDTGSYRCQASDGTTTVQTDFISVNVYTPLAVNAQVRSYTPTLGQTLSINCVITAGTPTSIAWFKNGQTVVIANDARLSGGSTNSPPLVISPVQSGDTGSYRCQASDGITTDQTDFISVNVYTQLSINAPVTSYTPTLGQTLSINCVITAGTPTSITWFKNGQTVVIASDGRFSGGSTNSPPLVISPVQSVDTGSYRCQASDGTITVQSSFISVNVYTQLAVNAPLTSYTPTIGQALTINCVVTSGSATSITWYKNGQLLTVASNARLSGAIPSSPSLMIFPVQTGDAGSYRCQATDGTTTVQTDFITVNTYVSLAVTVDQTTYTPTLGNTFTLNCRVTSGTAITINWYKNNQLISIPSNARFSGGTPGSPSMTIVNAQMSDAGSYQCEAVDATQSVRTSTITVSPIDPTVTEEDIITTILNGYNKLVRPTPSPTIEHSIHMTRIVQCDGDTLVVQGYTCMYWYDQRLTWTTGQDSVSLPSSEIWLPDVTQEGEKPDFYTAPVWAAEKVAVTKDGRVGFCPQGLFTTTSCLEKVNEQHECTMKFRSWSYEDELIDINVPTSRDSIDISGLEVHSEFEIVSRCAIKNKRNYACCGSRLHPDVMYTIGWQRKRIFCENDLQQPTCNS